MDLRLDMIELFNNYSGVIVFLHVLSGVIWVGGMIAIRVAVHPSMQSIEEPKIKLGKTLMITGKLFQLVMPFIAILLLTAIVMISIHSSIYVYIKVVIWIFMTLNFSYMYIKRASAQKLFDGGDLKSAKVKVSDIPNFLLPINIVLGVIAIYLGVLLRGL
jgi:uncharacterized membrane protein